MRTCCIVLALLSLLLNPAPSEAQIVIRPDDVIWEETIPLLEKEEEPPQFRYTTALVCDDLDQVKAYFVLNQRHGSEIALKLVNWIYPPQERLYPLACEIMTVTYTRGKDIWSFKTNIGRLVVVEVEIRICHDSTDVVLSPGWNRVLVLMEEAS